MKTHGRARLPISAKLGSVLLLAAAALGALLALVALAAPGDLDPTFDGDGKVTTDFGSNYNSGYAVAIQPDGKIVVAGYANNGGDNDFALARYEASGALDTAFGTSGVVTTDLGGWYEEKGYAVAIQPDGKIVVAGISDFDFALARYEVSGTLDTSFGTGGKVTTDLGNWEIGNAVAIQPDGKIVVAGGANNGSDDDFALVRYNTDGSLDNTFGSGGVITTPIGRYDYGNAIAIQSDGKIVVAGYTESGDDSYDFAVVRYEASGAPDTTFGASGVVTTDFGSGSDQARAVAIHSDGKIVVAGYANNGSDNDFALARYETSGTLDATFGASGIVTADLGIGDDYGNAVAIQPDGRIVIAGSSRNTNDDFALARYETSGTLDITFGASGVMTTDFGSGNDSGNAVAIQPDGRIVVAGDAYNGSNFDFALARYDTRVIGSVTVGTSETAIGDTNVKARLESGSCNVAVTKTIAFPGGSSDPGEMPTYWDITTDCSPGTYSMMFSLCYTDPELANGIDLTEENLVAFKRIGGGAWANQDGAVDTGANCVAVSGVSSLSQWTLGDPTAPGNNWPTASALVMGAWTPLGGPNIAGGLGRALAVHPAISGTLYAAVQPVGTAWNWNLPSQIYGSTDGGANWTSLYTTPHNVRALAVTGTIVYAGAYNRVGYALYPVLYRSGDGGLNWTTPISFAEGTIWALDVHPTLAQTAIAGGGDYPDEAVLYQTSDGGVSWTEIFSYTNPGGYSAVNAVLIHPTTPLTWLLSYDGQVGGTTGATIVRSTDGGANWTEVYTITDDYVTDLVANPITPIIIYAATNNNNLYRSADGGATWVAVVTDGSAGRQLVLDPPDTLYACIEYSWEVRKSTDGGDTWFTVGWANGEVWDLAINLGSTPATLYAGLDKSTDGGTSWVSNYNGIETPAWPWDIDVDPQDPARLFVAGACSGGFVTTDGGDTWAQPAGLPACMNEFAINPAAPDIVYGGTGACNQGAVLRSEDGGLTFQTVYTAPFIVGDCSAGQANVYALAIAPSMSSTVYAAGGDQLNWQPERAVVLRSPDDGVSWTEVFTLSGESGIHPMAIDPTDADVVFAGGYDCTDGPCIGIIYRTTDGGDNWTLVLTSTAEVSSIVFDSALPDTVYAADYGYRVYKSSDGGDSWTVVRCLPWETCANPGLSGDMLAADPRRSNVIYLSGWGYVGESTDGGQTWSGQNDPLNQGMVDAPFSYLATDNDAVTQTLYGGYYGVWVYRRAALPGGIIRVATAGTDAPGCGSAALPCRTVQYAMDKAQPGDEIRVATGTYTGVQTREGITQVAYISKTVAVRGGYTTADWATSDPVANPTTLDAQGLGRVLVLSNTASTTVAGLRITGGDASGIGGSLWGQDAGGGVYVCAATATISQCVIFSNTASTVYIGYGGGLYLDGSDATMTNNTIISNTAGTVNRGYGGGLYLTDSDYVTLSGNTIQNNLAGAVGGSGGGILLDSVNNITLNNNTVQSNTASTGSGTMGALIGYGGGLYLTNNDHVTLTTNTIISNTASTGSGSLDIGFGGGLNLNSVNDALLSGNTVQGNTASTGATGGGGGLFLVSSAATLNGNTVQNNTAGASWGQGGGLFLSDGTATLQSNTIRHNTASTAGDGYGGGLYLLSDSSVLSNNTVSGNTASVVAHGYGGGLYLESSPTMLSDNTIISNIASVDDWGEGGGLRLENSPATLNGNTVQDNTASTGSGDALNGISGYGGGLYLTNSDPVTLTTNTIISNTASTGSGPLDSGYGGGVYLYSVNDTTLDGNTVKGNTGSTGSTGRGGGVYIEVSNNITLTSNAIMSNTASASGGGVGGGLYLGNNNDVTLSGNTVRDNTASAGGNGAGGGLYLSYSVQVTLSDNSIISNTAGTGAGSTGGGLDIFGTTPLALTNNVVADNRATSSGQGRGSGLYFSGDFDAPVVADLFHTTIADNGASGSGEGVYVSDYTTLAFTNTIIAGHASAGITVTAGSTATLAGTVWYDNGADTGGGGTIVTGTVNVSGDPAFVDPGGGDYHIRTESAALDAGIFAGVTTDLDGDARPTNTARPDAPDLGADENSALTVCRPVTTTMTFGAACARVVFTDTGGLSSGYITVTVVPGRFPTVNPADQVVSRTVIITPSTGATVSATLTLCYEDSEVKSGLDESQLQLYRWTGSGWQAYTSSVDTANNLVTGGDVTAFSPWAMGDRDNGPTAVELSSFTTQDPGSAILIGWSVTAAIGISLVTLACLRRRRWRLQR